MPAPRSAYRRPSSSRPARPRTSTWSCSTAARAAARRCCGPQAWARPRRPSSSRWRAARGMRSS